MEDFEPKPHKDAVDLSPAEVKQVEDFLRERGYYDDIQSINPANQRYTSKASVFRSVSMEGRGMASVNWDEGVKLVIHRTSPSQGQQGGTADGSHSVAWNVLRY